MFPPAVLAVLFLSCFLEAADARGFVSEASKEKLRAMSPAEKRKIVGIALGVGFPALFAFIFLCAFCYMRPAWHHIWLIPPSAECTSFDSVGSGRSARLTSGCVMVRLHHICADVDLFLS